jgi:3-deoxy-D-arabino-heptulosonate 7-phosphate (DAHP) synthase class II
MAEQPAMSLLRKLLTGGYADLEKVERGHIILLDTSWLDITAEEAKVAESIWKEANDAAA